MAVRENNNNIIYIYMFFTELQFYSTYLTHIFSTKKTTFTLYAGECCSFINQKQNKDKSK